MLILPSLYAIQVGNFGYFLFLFLLGTLFFLARSLSRHYGMEWTHRFLLALFWGNFALHFLKLLSPFSMKSFPFFFTRSSLENFCAILIVTSPFIYLYGNAYWKDYLYYIGIVSGVMVYLAPTAAIGADLSNPANFLEVMRFYLCHAPLVIGGYLTVDSGFHKLDYHRLWAVPFCFVAVNLVVLFNAVFLGLVLHYPGWPSTWAELSDRSLFTNQSYTFGPFPSLDPLFEDWLYPILPPFLCTYYVEGEIHFTPSIWQLIPVGFATLVLGPILSFPYESRHMKIDCLVLKEKIARRRATF